MSGVGSLRLQVAVLEKQMRPLKQERDDALREPQQIREGVERAQARHSALLDQALECDACGERRRAKALQSQDW